MDFHSLINLLTDDTWRSVKLILPELVLCATIVALLLTRVVKIERLVGPRVLTGAGLLLAIAAQVWLNRQPEAAGRAEVFTGLLVYDSVTLYFRIFLFVFGLLLLILTWLTGVPDADAGTDVYTLILGATLGMCFMASANHLLMIFMAVEMASVPSYALAGLMKGRRQSSEAALKYAIYGAGAAGIMLYGISLLAGVLGTCHLPTMALKLAEIDFAGGGGEVMALALGGLMTMVGLAFKLSAVPFHFWCPDVFEGATAEVNAFLSVASKGAALALVVRIAFGLGHVPTPDTPTKTTAAADTTTVESGRYAALSVADDGKSGETKSRTPVLPPLSADDANAKLSTPRNFMARVIAFLAVITCTFGNLAAYGQSNIKRMLAYSTIAHAGYMMMPIAAALVLLGDPATKGLAEDAVSSILFYVVVYLFMNLGAFGVIAFLRNKLRSEQIEDYAGLVNLCPTIVVCFAIMLFSLVGLPPLAGFAGKFLIFTALGNAELWTLLVVAGVNTVLSLFYYLRVVRVMTIEPEPPQRLPVTFSALGLDTWFTLAMTIMVVVLGLLFNDLLDWAQRAASALV